MAKVVTFSNILNPLERQTQEVEATTSTELINMLDFDTKIYEVVVSRNQEIITEEVEIVEGDVFAITVIPIGGGGGGGKDIIKSIAMIVVAVVVTYYTQGAGAGLFGQAGSLSSYVATGVGMAAGGMLINAILPPQIPSYDGGTLSNIQNSATYSWDLKGNSVEQGKPVPILYGTHRVTPPLISQYVETKDNLQYLNVLYAVADGETTINTSSIKINDEPISNFNSVTMYTRDGTLDQSIIGIFDDTHSDKQVNKKLSTDWQYSTTTGNSVTGLEIGLIASSGIYFVDSTGNFQNYTIKVDVQYYYNGQWIYISGSENTISVGVPISYIVKGYNTYYKFLRLLDAQNYRRYGYNIGISTTLPTNTKIYESGIWGEYSTEVVDNSFSELTDNKQETLRYTYKVNGLPPDQYETRARFYEAPTEGSRYGSDMYFEYLQETVTDDFIYPGTALLGLSILATDQLSGSLPKITVKASNNISNPSNACIDILEKSGETLSTEELEKFTEFEEWCDLKSYTCNIYFDEIYTVRSALNMVSKLGRAAVLQYGSQWSVNIDKPNELPVQSFLFTMGNIKADSFSEEFLPIQDRTNKIEITYYDETVDNEPQIIEVSNSNYDEVENVNTSSINYIGCTDRTMALQYAKFLLNCSRLLTITQSFTVATELIVGRVGDVIKVAHDLPGIGESGRIISASTTGVVLDREVTLTLGINYYVELRYSNTNEIITTEVVNTVTTTDTLTFTIPLLISPEKYDVYSFGEYEKTSKLMRIVDISKSSDLESKISALEYVADVYDDAEYIIPHTESVLGLRGLSLNEAISYENTSIISSIIATWRGASLYYDVYINDEFYKRIYKDSIKIENQLAPSSYIIKVVDSLGKEESKSISLLGRFAPPEPPTNFKAIQNDNIVRFSWDKSIAQDVAKYEIRTGVTWENSKVIGIVGNVNTFEWFPDMNATYRFWIKSLDFSKIYSQITQEYQFNVTNIDEKLNAVIEYDGIDTATPICSTNIQGLIFITGQGYVSFNSVSWEDLGDITWEDLGDLAWSEEAIFESCVLDTTKQGITKIRILSGYSATFSNPSWSDLGDRTWADYPFDTWESFTAVDVFMNLFYSISNDNITFTDWVEYTGVVDEDFRYIKFKYEIESGQGVEVNIDTFKAILDVPDTFYDIRDIEIVNSTTISYNTLGLTFYEKPFIKVISKDSISFAVIKNESNSSFDIEAYDENGSLKTATFDINIQGY